MAMEKESKEGKDKSRHKRRDSSASDSKSPLISGTSRSRSNSKDVSSSGNPFADHDPVTEVLPNAVFGAALPSKPTNFPARRPSIGEFRLQHSAQSPSSSLDGVGDLHVRQVSASSSPMTTQQQRIKRSTSVESAFNSASPIGTFRPATPTGSGGGNASPTHSPRLAMSAEIPILNEKSDAKAFTKKNIYLNMVQQIDEVKEDILDTQTKQLNALATRTAAELRAINQRFGMILQVIADVSNERVVLLANGHYQGTRPRPRRDCFTCLWLPLFSCCGCCQEDEEGDPHGH